MTREDKDFSLQKVPGRKSIGSFTLNNQKWAFRDLVLRNDTSMWQIWIAAEEGDPEYVKVMNQIVKGMKF